MTDSTRLPRDPNRYECDNCHKLLFRGHLRLLLTKSATEADCIEIKCSRCGLLNTFIPQLQVLKSA